MEYKDPMFELLSSLEQIVFKDVPQPVTMPVRSWYAINSKTPLLY